MFDILQIIRFRGNILCIERERSPNKNKKVLELKNKTVKVKYNAQWEDYNEKLYKRQCKKLEMWREG